MLNRNNKNNNNEDADDYDDHGDVACTEEFNRLQRHRGSSVHQGDSSENIAFTMVVVPVKNTHMWSTRSSIPAITTFLCSSLFWTHYLNGKLVSGRAGAFSCQRGEKNAGSCIQAARESR